MVWGQIFAILSSLWNRMCSNEFKANFVRIMCFWLDVQLLRWCTSLLWMAKFLSHKSSCAALRIESANQDASSYFWLASFCLVGGWRHQRAYLAIAWSERNATECNASTYSPAPLCTYERLVFVVVSWSCPPAHIIIICASIASSTARFDQNLTDLPGGIEMRRPHI